MRFGIRVEIAPCTVRAVDMVEVFLWLSGDNSLLVPCRLSREEKQFNRELQRVIEVSSPQLVAPGLVAVGDDKGRARGRESEEESKGVHSSTDGEQLNQLVGESDKGRFLLLHLTAVIMTHTHTHQKMTVISE